MKSGSFYVFDRAYNDYHRLYKIHMMDSYFVVRAKTNIKARVLKWKRRLPKNILSDCEIELTGFYMENPQRCDPVCQTGLTLLKKMLNTPY